jgi:fatty acid desaturase
MFDTFKQALRDASEFGPIATFFTFFQGRCTTFAIFFALIGLVLASIGVWGFVHGKDLSSFASFVSSFAMFAGAIFTGLVAHSTKEDWMAIKQSTSTTTAVTTVAPTSVTTTKSSELENEPPNLD